MFSYLTEQQINYLCSPIAANRVGADGKGFAYLEQYDVRAHLSRIFGFGRWSADLLDLTLIFEDVGENSKKQTTYTVGYRATMRLTVMAPDGTVLATYTEAAVGDSTNQPSHADAHDLALKTAESQALKRCAINLGDQFGLGLYAKGSRALLIKGTFVRSDQPVTVGEAQAAETVVTDIDPVVPDAETPSTVAPEPPSGAVTRPPEDVVKEIAAVIAAIPAKASPRAKQIALAKIKLDYRGFLYASWGPNGQTVNAHIDALIAEAKAETEATP